MESHRSTRLLQLTIRWQYDGIGDQHYAPRLLMSTKSDPLLINQVAAQLSSSDPKHAKLFSKRLMVLILIRLRGSCSKLNPLLKLLSKRLMVLILTRLRRSCSKLNPLLKFSKSTDNQTRDHLVSNHPIYCSLFSFNVFKFLFVEV